MATERRRVPAPTPMEAAPLAVVVAGMLLGVVAIVLGHWRLGSVFIGSFLIIGGLERLLLPQDRAGLLQARNRFFDVIALLAMGIAIVGLAFVVPAGNSTP